LYFIAVFLSSGAVQLGKGHFTITLPLTEVGGRVRLRSAHRGDLSVPSTRTEFGKHSFRVAAPRTWNSLPLHLRSPTISRQQFQSGLKTHLFKCAYIWLLPPRTIEEWTYLLLQIPLIDWLINMVWLLKLTGQRCRVAHKPQIQCRAPENRNRGLAVAP